MNKEQTRRILGNLALAVVSLTICLALTEVVLRSTLTLDTGRSQEFRIPHSEFGWVLEPDASYLYKLLEELDIAFIDLLPEFPAQMLKDNMELYWRSDRHWNPKEHELAANLVGAFLAKESLIPMNNAAR